MVGAQIRKLRQKRGGISQQQLAERIQQLGRKMSQPVIGRMEAPAKGTGEARSITIADLFAVAAALDVAPAELLAASFDPQSVPIVGDIELTPRYAFDWIRGDRPLPDGDERLYWEAISDERYQANLRVRGLWNLRGVLSDYEEAAMRDDVHGMEESLRVLRDEVDRQQQNLEHYAEHWTAERQKRRQRRAGGGNDAS